jgi:hypothetical protein
MSSLSVFSRSYYGIGQSTLVSPDQRVEPWLSSSVSSSSPIYAKLMIDIYFLFAGFHLLFSIYMVIGIPCTSPTSKIEALLMNSGGFGGTDQHNRNVLPRAYCSWYFRSILLNRLDHPSSRRWDLVQEGKLA